MTSPDYATLVVEVWKKIIDVQQHFNQIEMTIRNWAVTLFVGVIGTAALAIEKGLVLSMFSADIPLAAILLMSGALAWAAFLHMEFYWYHVYLRAAGEQAGILEAAWRTFLPEMNLSTKISERSAVPFLGRVMTSSQRLKAFYAFGIGILLALSLASFWAHAPKASTTSVTESKQSPETISADLARAAASLAVTATRLAEAAIALDKAQHTTPVQPDRPTVAGRPKPPKQ
jgi:hypothetical protein